MLCCACKLWALAPWPWPAADSQKPTPPQPTPLLLQVSALDAYRAQQRDEWEKRFLSTLARNQQAGRSFVSDLPEFCVAETRGVKRLAALGISAVLLQAFAAYCALGLGRVLPKKGE